MKKYVIIIVVVALAIAGATAYAIVQQNAAQIAFENSIQCQSLGANWLKNNAPNDVPIAFSGGIPPGYNTHYNRKLGTCLIALSVMTPQAPGSNDEYYWVINLLTNETVAGFDSINGGATTTYTNGMGDLGPNATYAQYDAEEKQLMTE
jgi:hypothetical protein